MLKETNIEKLFVLLKSLLKSDVNKHTRDSKDNKTTLLGCNILSKIE
jgi:hypothetical protein